MKTWGVSKGSRRHPCPDRHGNRPLKSKGIVEKKRGLHGAKDTSKADTGETGISLVADGGQTLHSFASTTVPFGSQDASTDVACVSAWWPSLILGSALERRS
ncbi:hypothetical protein AC1031_012379 [Aphanomyces cochlioides]|nr:hypothetical protein AC1031_012379 [Aphanomyces cochlioides]